MSGEKFDLCAQVKASLLELMQTMSSTGKIQLPSEKRLADQLQVSRGTIRTVLATLESEGRIFRRHGSGTYLNLRAAEVNTTLYPHMYFSELIEQSGYLPSVRILDVSLEQEAKIAERLGLPPDQKVVCVRKLYLADGKMCVYCKDFFDQDLFPMDKLLSLKTEPVSTFQFFDKFTDLSVSWNMLRLDVTDTIQTPELANYAAVSEHTVKPYLCIEAVTYDQQSRPMFFGYAFVDTGMIDLYLIKHHMGDGKTAASPL